MHYEEKTSCPHCHYHGPIQRDFGYRRMKDGSIRPQSWCRICRREEQKRRRRMGNPLRRY